MAEEHFRDFGPGLYLTAIAMDDLAEALNLYSKRGFESREIGEGIRAQLKVLGSPSTYASAGSGRFVSAAAGVSGDDLAEIIYTSGTTGFPKGVMHTHRDLVLTGEAFTLCAGLNSEDRLMIILPLFHANAQYTVLWARLPRKHRWF
jgi:long-subunit acyl-CoA synthetase (AMP-forming)